MTELLPAGGIVKRKAKVFIGLILSFAMGAFVPGSGNFSEVLGQGFEGDLIPDVSTLRKHMNSCLRSRDPEAFWEGKRVVQRSGIVIEDADYLVRKQYWVLDQFVVGEVVGVELEQGRVFVEVSFSSMQHWERRVFEDREGDVRTETQRSVRFTRYGQDEEVVTTRKEVAGTYVEPTKCGVILRKNNESINVRFPERLLELEPPSFHAIVKRGVDWVDGFADGGATAVGNSGDNGSYLGRVVNSMTKDRMVEVEWEATGIRQLHRYGVGGFYAIELVDNGEAITPEMVARLREEALGEGPGGGGRGGDGVRGAGIRPPSRGSQPPGPSPQGYGSQPPSSPPQQGYGSQPPGSSPQQGYGSQPPGSSSQSYGTGSPSGS